MKRKMFHLVALPVLLGFLACQSHAQDSVTIVNNSTAPVYTNVLFGVSDLAVAQEFRMPNDGQNYRLDSVTLFGLSTAPAGSTTFDVILYDVDSQGLPGNIIGTISRETLQVNVSSLTAIPSGALNLLSGTSYYIAMDPSLFDSVSPEMYWSLTTSTESTGLGSLGQYAYYTTAPILEPWIGVPGNAGLLSISASPVAVPEPSSLSLLSCAAAALLLFGASFGRKARCA